MKQYKIAKYLWKADGFCADTKKEIDCTECPFRAGGGECSIDDHKDIAKAAKAYYKGWLLGELEKMGEDEK
jgi:hypothetical protein